MTAVRSPILLCFIVVFMTLMVNGLQAQGIDYRYAQSPVKSMAVGPVPFAYPVCDMLETFTGLPSHLDGKHLLNQATGRDIGLASTFYQYMLEEVGLVRYDSLHPAFGFAKDRTHYRCAKGTVLTLQEPSRISSPDKIISLLQQGIKGVAVYYAYNPKDWKKGNWHLDQTRGKGKTKERHAVLIVGYQDSSFIFKNSWSTKWGEQGYGRMSFAYHRSHAQEGLLAYMAEAAEPDSGVAQLALKTQPEILEGEKFLQVSLIAAGVGKFPDIAAIDFELIQQPVAMRKTTLLSPVSKPIGYPCLIAVPFTDKPFDLKVNLTLAGAAKPKTVVLKGLYWRNFELPLPMN